MNDDRDKVLLAKRQILLQQKVDVVAQERISSSILYLNALDLIAPITFFIDCSGGAMGSGSFLMDTIRNSTAPVHGIVIGAAYSMAFSILQVCHERLAYEHASLMFHATSANDVRIDQENFDETITRFRERDRADLDFLAHRSGQPLDKLQQWSKAEKRFTAREAKELGFLDEIVVSSK